MKRAETQQYPSAVRGLGVLIVVIGLVVFVYALLLLDNDHTLAFLKNLLSFLFLDSDQP